MAQSEARKRLAAALMARYYKPSLRLRLLRALVKCLEIVVAVLHPPALAKEIASVARHGLIMAVLALLIWAWHSLSR